jgi:hypothetical protein
MIEPLRYVTGLRQFQIIQDKIDHFTIRLVKGKEFTEATPEEVKQSVRKIVGNAEIQVSIDDIIPKSKTGKTKQFITRI